MFDANSFMQSVTTEANDTKTIPCPVGEYPGVIDKVEPKPWAKDGKAGVTLEVTWSIEDDNVKALLNRQDVKVRQSVFLDVNLQTGQLMQGPGTNVSLGRLREAVGKNQPGEQFSLEMLPGLAAKVAVVHREHKGDTFAEVKAAARL